MTNNIYLESFVSRGKNRKEVMISLLTGRKTQAEIHKITKLYRTHVRRCLNELIEKKLVKCLNPKDRINKWYELTLLGKEIIKKL